jgi:C-terminal processing protease CtpA/Prc
VFLLLLASANSARATNGLDELSLFLEERGILADPTQAVSGATAGLLKAVDPEARLCTTEEAAAWQAERSGAGPTGAVARAVDTFEMWPENIAYLKLRNVAPGGGEEVLAHLRALSDSPGIIVDLRGAGGDDLQTVVGLASPFYCPGEALFVLQDNRGLPVATNVAAACEPVPGFLMVLTDRGTCRAAEALAAVWRGSPGVMLVGAATRGDSRQRDMLALPDGRLLYIATRRLVPARGDDYEGKGVQPDVAVAAMSGGEAAFVDAPAHGKRLSAKSIHDRDLMRRVDGDAVLRRATDILLGLRALDSHGQR